MTTPQHPGVTLATDLAARKFSQSSLSARSGIGRSKISELICGKRAVTPQIAQRLEKALGTPARTWVALQAEYDAAQAKQAQRESEKQNRRVHPLTGRGDDEWI